MFLPSSPYDTGSGTKWPSAPPASIKRKKTLANAGAPPHSLEMAKISKNAGRERKAGAKVLGVTKDGVRILKPKGKATHFTWDELRDTVVAVRAAKRA